MKAGMTETRMKCREKGNEKACIDCEKICSGKQ